MTTNNPYAPPEAKLADPAARPGSPLKALALGLLVDLGGTIIATILIVIAYGIVLGALGVSTDEIESATSNLSTDSALFYLTTLAGLGFSVLGGYVCARIARRAELKLGAFLAAISAGSGLALGGDPSQLGMLISLSILGVAAVLAGANIGRAKNRRAD